MSLPYHDKLDALFMQPDEEVSDLERAARICDVATVEASNIMVALRTSIAATNIRQLPGWQPYQRKSNVPHPLVVETQNIMKQLVGIQPKDIFFYAGYEASYDDDGEIRLGQTLVVMCPITFFREKGYCSDKHLSIPHLLPDFMGECGECLFDSTKTAEQTRQELLARGFVEDVFFSEFCKDHNPFC